MSDRLTFELGGFDALNAKLRELQGAPARRVVMAGLRKGAQTVKQSAQAAAPVRQRDLARVIRIGTKSTRVRGPRFLRRTIAYKAVRGALVIEVGPRRAAFYGQFFEFGRDGRSMPRRAWLTEAFRGSVDLAFGRISGGMWDQLAKEVAKLGE